MWISPGFRGLWRGIVDYCAIFKERGYNWREEKLERTGRRSCCFYAEITSSSLENGMAESRGQVRRLKWLNVPTL